MGEIVKDTIHGLPWYMYVTLAISAGLLIASFVLPPQGQIDPSVLKGAGLMIGGTFLFNLSVNLPRYIKAGASVRMEHGNSSIEVTSNGTQG